MDDEKSIVDTVIYALIIFVIIYIIFNKHKNSKPCFRPVCNRYDGRCYKVHTRYNDAEKASYKLAQLNRYSVEILRMLRNKYLWGNGGNGGGGNAEQRKVVQRLINHYNADGIKENNPLNDINTSYVDDKGRVYAICLREKLSGKNNFHSDDDLHFVVLHEMAHMASETYGHNAEFWINFKFLLRAAEEAGMHKNINYAITPINYCRLHLAYNPFFDDTIPNL